MRPMIDFFPAWMTGDGIFSALSASGDMPWSDDLALGFDLDYFGNRSGTKAASTLLESIANESPLDETAMARVVSVIKAKYLPSWQRLWELTELEYNPIDNYDGTETYTRTSSDTTKTATDTTSTTGTDSDVTTTQTVKQDVMHDVTQKTYGLGSTDGKTTSSSQDHTTGSAANNESTTRTTGSADDNVVTTRTTGDADDNVVTSTHMETFNTHRHGNLGITTSAQMILGEKNLWGSWHVIDSIMHDIDEVLCAPVYMEV